MKHNFKFFAFAFVLALGFLTSCGDEEVKEVIIREVDTVFIGKGQEVANPQADALLANAYATWLKAMYNNQGHAHAVQTFAADLTMLPTRGTDWFDGGKWQVLQKHEWDPAHKHVEESWKDFASGLSNSLAALNQYESKQFPVLDKQAQAKAMVAYHAWLFLDHFGKIPYDRKNSGTITILEGANAIAEIEKLLREAIADLNDGNSGNSTIFTKPAAQAILAKLYLNKAVYTDRYGTPNFAAADMDTVYKYTTAIIESGGYALETDYFRMFDYDNGFNSEFILVVEQFNNSDDKSFGRNDLAGNQYGRSHRVSAEPEVRGSNGGCISPEFYDMWGDFRDPRAFERHIADAEGTMSKGGEILLNRGILRGQQYGPVYNDAKDAFQEDGSGNYLIKELVADKDPSVKLNFTRDVDVTGGTSGLLAQRCKDCQISVRPHQWS